MKWWLGAGDTTFWFSTNGFFFSSDFCCPSIVYLALNNSTPSWPQAACENAAFFWLSTRLLERGKGFSEESRKIRISEKPKRWSSCLLKYKKKLKAAEAAEKRNKGWWHDVEGLHGTEVWCSCYFYPPVFHILRRYYTRLLLRCMGSCFWNFGDLQIPIK